MALQAEILSFTIGSGTGTITVPHVRYPSIAGKGFLFCFSNFVAGPSSEVYSFGVDDGTHHIGSSGGVSTGAGTQLSARGVSSQYSILRTQSQITFGGAQTILKAYVSAVNVGSFDVTVDLNVNSNGTVVTAVMIGGDDVDCAAGLYDVSGGSGTVNVGFDPVALIHLSAPDSGTTTEVAGTLASYGFATVCDTDHQVGLGLAVGSITSAASSYQLEDKIKANVTAGSTVVSNEVTLAFVANGFSLTFSGTPNSDVGYLAIGGAAVSANLVEITQPTSTGVQNVAITATDPVIAFFASTCKVATTGMGSADANFAFGVHDGVSSYAQWWGTVNGTSNPNFKFDHDSLTTSAILLDTATGPSVSTRSAVATCAFSSENLALTWSAADSTQRQVWALVLAQNLTGSSNPCGANPQASITVLKQTTPIAGGETEFPFTTSGGLSPSSFTLMDGESQLFSALSTGTYGVSEVAPDGWTATYAVSNGDSHAAITVTGTEAITVTVTNTFATTTPTFRIYRRFALPYDEHYFTYLNRLEIVAQAGVGNASAANPIIKIRFSKDGGSTFGDFRTMSLGAATEYTKRAYINRVGRGRDLVAELICDDPVVVAWVQCLVEGEKATGTN